MFRKRMPRAKMLLAAKMRREETPAETAMRKALRRIRKQHGLSWRNQHPTLGYIVDFYNVSRRIAVEVDGGYHSTRQSYDAFRDRILMQRLGATVIRIPNEVVLSNPEAVADQIAVIALTRPELHGSRSANLPGGNSRIFIT